MRPACRRARAIAPTPSNVSARLTHNHHCCPAANITSAEGIDLVVFLKAQLIQLPCDGYVPTLPDSKTSSKPQFLGLTGILFLENSRKISFIGFKLGQYDS